MASAAARTIRPRQSCRAMLPRLVLLSGLAALILTACSPRGELAILPDPVPGAVVQRIHVATTRAPAPAGPDFTGHRGAGLTFAQAEIAVPPRHRPGRIRRPHDGIADPLRHFTAREVTLLPDAAAFTRGLDDALRDNGHREIVLHIHGFNVNFAEGLYRIAQMTNDLRIPGQQAAFSWASAGHPLGYVHDRDSVHIDRDALETLLISLARSRAETIILVAHSMGAFLVMEALRQLSIRGDEATLSRIGGVVLISPDIDVAVFRRQVAAIARLPQPFVIFSSDRDQALHLSARITGERMRLGSMPDAGPVADLPVTVIDTSAFAADGQVNHSVPTTSPALVSILARLDDYIEAIDLDQVVTTGLLPGTVTLFGRATNIVLNPMAR
ncbi:MAG: alpha/beta fold hydrolase [Rhodobacteraceae bacterium]|nr:alpha/beta fold hydrolase [Paracoccaceae bacterium]